MERKTLGILALALLGVFAISMVVAVPFGNSEDRDAMRNAVEAGDYETWSSLKMSQITEENFNERVEMHKLRSGGEGGCQGKMRSGGERGSCGAEKSMHEDCPFAN